MKLWGGRFQKTASEQLDAYNSSLSFDKCLASFDVQGSLAHIKMLGKCGFVSQEYADKIAEALPRVLEKIQSDGHCFDCSDEDIHMHVEKLLFEEIGDSAGHLHTGRSRNDQVALDMHMYLRFNILKVMSDLMALCSVLLVLAIDHVDVIMPGYTHLQRAEPVRFSHHILAYFNMFYRDVTRLQESYSRVNVMPLGAGALAGSGFNVDRQYVAELLNFDSLYENSLDAVSNRDHCAELLFNASLVMMHFSRFSEELILWCSEEFGFIALDDELSTGSSMMPQKKNPDIPELARGKTGRVYGALMGLLTVMKGLPLAYNKDLQEDKEGLFDVINTLNTTIPLYTELLNSMKINGQAMHQAACKDYSNATVLANYLVGKGYTFRDAHKTTGEIVYHSMGVSCFLLDLPLLDYQSFAACISADVYDCLKVEAVVEAHSVSGGTAKASVLMQLDSAQLKMKKIQDWLDNIQPSIKEGV